MVIFMLTIFLPLSALAANTSDNIWGPWIIDKQPTCTEPGQEHHIATQGNGAIEYAVIPALGHDYVVVSDTPATCTELEIKTYRCTRCGDTYTEKVGEPLGHDYIGVDTKEPTCTEPGVKTFTCSRCGDSYTEPIPALGHDWGPWTVETPAQPGVPGMEVRVCLRCGDKETRETTALPVAAVAPVQPPINKPFPGTLDYVFGGVDIGILGAFSVLLVPRAADALYIRRRRKTLQRLKYLREQVAKLYGFK